MSMWSETIPVSEAAERLLAFIHEIRALDDQYEKMMRRKADIYRQAKRDGYNKLAIKTIANDPTTDDDTKVLRKDVDLLCGPEAAAAMRDADHFGTIPFGASDSWPTDYLDPKHGLANAPTEE